MLVLTRGAGRRIRRAGWSSRRKRGGAGVGRRRPSTKISVRSGAEDGEGGVDGAPDSKVKSWRRLAEAERRRMCVPPVAQALCSDSGNAGGAARALGWRR